MTFSLKQRIKKTMKRKKRLNSRRRRRGRRGGELVEQASTNVVDPGKIIETPNTIIEKQIPVEQAGPTKEENDNKCEENFETIKKKLQKKGIESFSSSEESDEAFKFASHEYDKIAKKIETAKTATVILDVFGLGFAPLAQASIVSKVAIYGISKYEKSKQVSYISSQCLSFLSNISRDLAEINAFYSCKAIKETNIKMDTTLYDILNKNLFTFLYFLIDSIDFTLTKLGAYQYLFWHTFLVKLDFNKINFDKPIPMSIYRYSCEECIPPALRKKLQELSKQPFKNSFKTYINFDNLNFDKVDKEVTDLKIRTRTGYIWKKDSTNKTTLSKFGFCSAKQLALCKNYNDTIVRLIEFNMYKLIDTTYKHRDQLDINNKHIANRTKIAEFLKAVFCYPIKLISKEDKAEFADTFKTKFKTKLQDPKTVIPDSKQQIIVVSICFDFLIELNRLICELEYTGFISVSKAMSGVLANAVSKFVGASFTFFGSPLETYNILMREYTMMTGNFGMMSTRYTLDYNGLTNDLKEKVTNQVSTVLAKVEKSLNVIGEDLKNTATTLNKNSEGLNDDNPDETIVETGGGLKRYNKNKYSKKSRRRCK